MTYKKHTHIHTQKNWFHAEQRCIYIHNNKEYIQLIQMSNIPLHLQQQIYLE